MTPSSIMCRAQEALHRRRAADTMLENVRMVATKAAIAWEREAVAAESRERRQPAARPIADHPAPSGPAEASPANADID